MVEKVFNVFNFKSQPSLDIGKVNHDNNDIVITGKPNNNNGGGSNPKNSKNTKYNYVKILVDDPLNNRDIILKVTKNQKGIIPSFTLFLSLLLLPFTLYLTGISLLCIESLADLLDLSFEIKLHYAVVPLLVYDNAESKRKEVVKDNTNKAGVYR